MSTNVTIAIETIGLHFGVRAIIRSGRKLLWAGAPVPRAMREAAQQSALDEAARNGWTVLNPPLLWVLEAHGADRVWCEEACGATGRGRTQFATEAEAEDARRSLIALDDGWSEANTRVRRNDGRFHQRIATA